MASRTDRLLRPDRPSGGWRVLNWVLILLVVVFFGWTALWYAAAAYVKGEFDERTTALAREGRADIACGRRDVEGFPFEFRFVCDEDVMVETDRADVALSALESCARVWEPSTIRSTLDGPASVALGPGTRIVADWKNAALTVRDAFDRRSATVVLADLSLDAPQANLLVSQGEAALLPEGPDLRATLDAADVTLTLEGREPVTFARLYGDMTLRGLHRRLVMLGRSFEPANGLEGRIEGIGLQVGEGGRLHLSGPFSVSPEGLLSGRFTIAVRDPAELQGLVVRLTDLGDQFSGALTALSTLGEERTIDGVQMRAIELSAVDGKLPFGFVTVDLPRIWERPPSQ